MIIRWIENKFRELALKDIYRRDIKETCQPKDSLDEIVYETHFGSDSINCIEGKYLPPYNAKNIDINRLDIIDYVEFNNKVLELKDDMKIYSVYYIDNLYKIIINIKLKYGKTPIVFVSPLFVLNIKTNGFSNINKQKIEDIIKHVKYLGLDIRIADIGCKNNIVFAMDENILDSMVAFLNI